MSIKIMSQIWDCGPDNKGQLLVLLALSDYANDEGIAWPAVGSIAKKSRMTDRGVQKILRQLEDLGWLETVLGNGRKGTNTYRINPEPETPNTVHPELETPNQSAETPNRSAQNPEPCSPNPLRTIIEPSKGKPDLVQMMSVVLSQDVAVAFFEHRKTMKKPLTEHSAKLLIAELRKCRDPDAAANRSILGGYPSVYPDGEAKRFGTPQQSQKDKYERMGR